MTRSIAEHYELHLAEHYSWLFGGLPDRVAENRALFEEMKLQPAGTKKALDVGSGSGFQTLPLAQLGFHVTAVDLSQRLLAELASHAAGLPVTTVHDDILRWIGSEPTGYELAVCMGDTLTHLVHFGDVQRLFREVHRLLVPGGRFVVAFRDYTGELQGADRFIPVRGDERTIFSCFLEYEGDHVRVYDVLQQREADAGWTMKVSAYRKLRIGRAWAEKRAGEAGFEVVSSGDKHGMVMLVLGKK